MITLLAVAAIAALAYAANAYRIDALNARHRAAPTPTDPGGAGRLTLHPPHRPPSKEEPTVTGRHLVALVAGLAAAYGLHRLAALMSKRAAAADYERSVTDALLLLAEDRAGRAEQHADDAQVLLNSILGHSSTRDHQLTVIPGGAQ